MTDRSFAPPPGVAAPPPPWRRLPTVPVGGLFAVGYASGSDLILVLSSQGSSVVDARDGAKLARDRGEAHERFDPIRLLAEGFGPLDGQPVRMAGLFGGGLPLTTHDGWCLETRWLGQPPRGTVLLLAPGTSQGVPVGDDGACELRAVGFSETGGSFAIATSGDLALFARTPRTAAAPASGDASV